MIMQEIFYEESSLLNKEKAGLMKYRLLKIFSVVSYVMAGLFVVLFFNFYDLSNFNFLIFLLTALLPLAMFVAFGVILGRVKNNMFVDYDYTFVTGSVRVSKVIRRIKRKNVMKFETSDILQMGKYGSESYEKLEKTPAMKRVILTSNQSPTEGNNFYYLHVATEGTNKLLVFDCSEKFMATILRYSNKNILEKDYK
ncbi:MAG: hypothetical protein DBX59_10020 [Bacillota bacterium]|nr:MAG: hypothetical protein DBX59_10020 [Bacillota bacterium]